MDILQTNFSCEVETWEKLFCLYNKRDEDVDYSVFFEAISYAYAHPDHWISKGMYEFSAESEKYVRCKVNSFSEEDIINVLSIIENHYYDRGMLGQTADIISVC